MTDMYEIRAKVRKLRSAAYMSAHGLDVSVDDKEAALLQRVEALRDARDAALAAQKRAEEERDRLFAEVMAPCDCPAHLERKRAVEAEARAEAAESALAALRAAPPDAMREALTVASALVDEALRFASAAEGREIPFDLHPAIRSMRGAAERALAALCSVPSRRALAPAPPAALRPDPNTETGS